MTLLYLHQIHDAPPGPRADVRGFARTSGCPSSTRTTAARFAWYGTTTSAARFADEAITIVAFDDKFEGCLGAQVVGSDAHGASGG